MDRKFRSNRIEKSSSRTKVSDLSAENKRTIKKSNSGRRVQCVLSQQKLKHCKANDDKGENKEFEKSEKGQITLNPNALIRVVLNNKVNINDNQLTWVRKDLRFVTLFTLRNMAAKCKTWPDRFKNHSNNIVANVERGDDRKAERNVILVKKQPLDEELYGDYKSSENDLNAPTEDALQLHLKRYNSSGSQSNTNIQDEAFYSCDEYDDKESDKDLQNNQIKQIDRNRGKENDLHKKKDCTIKMPYYNDKGKGDLKIDIYPCLEHNSGNYYCIIIYDFLRIGLN